MLETPVLFLIFNRPEESEKVFKQICKVRPKYLFIAADGPRLSKPDDIEKCKQTKDRVLSLIDWECNVKTLFRDENLGCDRAPAGAISWFFDQVEFGIILEDDCLPSESFFYFCTSLLKRYQFEERIMMISGFNPLGTWYDKHVDYFYTEGSIWGWASWKRAWKNFDINLDRYKELQDKEYTNAIIEHEYPGATSSYKKIIERKLDAWDYQWHFARKINNGLSITTSVNLVENIGFGPLATHTTWELNPYNGIKAFERKRELRYNDLFIPDNLYKENVRKLEQTSKRQSILQRILNYIRKFK